MGGAWGVGALLVAGVGAVGDRLGLHTALLTLAALTLPGLWCAWALPKRPVRVVTSPAPAELAAVPVGPAWPRSPA
jgi:hypothetical protein